MVGFDLSVRQVGPIDIARVAATPPNEVPPLHSPSSSSEDGKDQ